MEHNDEKTQLLPARSAWILSASDASIGDTVVTPKKVVTIGRQTGCDIVIPDRYISRRHAEVFVRDDRLFVRDLQSTHGTLVNGKPVTECALNPGDEIRLDKAVFAVQQLGGPAQTAQQEGAPDADRTVIRRLDDVAASLDAAAAAPAAEAPSPPAPEPPPPSAPAPEAPPPAPASADVAAAPAAQDTTNEPAPGDASRSRNWWDPQDAGPMGTRLVQVQDALQDMQAQLAPQLDADRPMLVGVSPEFRDRQFELRAGKMIVGKKADADIRLDNAYVSDVHAQIVGEGMRWKVVNILSANGTFVNGKKIQAAYLRSGDVVRFGRVDLQFLDGSGGRLQKAGAPGAAAKQVSRAGIALGVALAAALLALGIFLLR